jgi:hypothetical protein
MSLTECFLVSDPDWLWRLVDLEYVLWIGAILLYGGGDTITTLWGLSREGIAETGPLVGPLIVRYGVSGLFVAKCVSLVAFGLVWYLLWKPTRVAVPVALVVVGGAVTVWNLLTIVASVS